MDYLKPPRDRSPTTRTRLAGLYEPWSNVLIQTLVVLYVTPISLLQPKKLVCSLLYGFNMEIIWLPGNLEIWLRYEFNMPVVEGYLAGTLRPPGGSRVESFKQLIFGRLRQEPHVFLI